MMTYMKRIIWWWPLEEDIHDDDLLEEDIYDGDLPEEDIYDDDLLEEDVYDGDLPEEDIYDDDLLEEDIYDDDLLEEDVYDDDLLEEDIYDDDLLEEDIYDNDLLEEDTYDDDLLEEYIYDDDLLEELVHVGRLPLPLIPLLQSRNNPNGNKNGDDFNNLLGLMGWRYKSNVLDTHIMNNFQPWGTNKTYSNWKCNIIVKNVEILEKMHSQKVMSRNVIIFGVPLRFAIILFALFGGFVFKFFPTVLKWRLTSSFLYPYCLLWIFEF
jgi:hypothetical protein